MLGLLGSSAVERLPSAQGMIPGSQDRVPHWAPHREPASPSTYVSASLSVSLMDKENLFLKKRKTSHVFLRGLNSFEMHRLFLLLAKACSLWGNIEMHKEVRMCTGEAHQS